MEARGQASAPAGDRIRLLWEYFRLTRIDGVVTAVAVPLELINITPGLLGVLAGVRWQAVAYLFSAFVVLLWRRRYPRFVLVILLIHQALFSPIFYQSLFIPRGMVFNPTEPFSIPYIPLFTVLVAVVVVGSICSPAVSTVFCIPAAVLPTVIFSAGRPMEAPWYIFASALWIGGAWSFGRFVGRASQRITDLETERLKTEAAMAAERAHIAAELHDIVSHAVTVMLLHAAGGRKIIDTDPSRAAQALDVIAAVGTEATQELSRLLGLLKTSNHAGPIKPLPTLDDIGPLLESIRGAGIDIEVQETGTPTKLDASVGHTAYRGVQEALTNVSKHVGPGTKALIQITWTPHVLRIEVSDTGPTQPPAGLPTASGYGLLGLQERVAVAGGRISWGPQEAGFAVRLTLPVAGAAGAAWPHG